MVSGWWRSIAHSYKNISTSPRWALACLAAGAAWAQAWASQDLEGYFNAYASNFEPEGGLTREAWQAQRRERISRPGDISVGVRDLRSEPTDSGARATFVQAYQSDNFSDVVTKVLDLVREGGGWKIAREYTR